jgi:hypothetical protein
MLALIRQTVGGRIHGCLGLTTVRPPSEILAATLKSASIGFVFLDPKDR